MTDIINRVSASTLVSIDMEEAYPQEERLVFDLKNFLFQELVLREKDFRQALKSLDWSVYEGRWVAITCTADAIVPTWAFMLVCIYLDPIAKGYVIGSLENLEQHISEQFLQVLPIDQYKDRPVVIKGCSKFPIPPFAYGRLISLLQGHVKSLMFGEPCSTVPLFKKTKS